MPRFYITGSKNGSWGMILTVRMFKSSRRNAAGPAPFFGAGPERTGIEKYGEKTVRSELIGNQNSMGV